MNFLPDSFLINNIYLPFYERPRVTIFNSDSQLKLETGVNQAKSVISIQEDGKNVIPFIDISKYDVDSRDWFWYDDEGFPMRGYIDYNNLFCLTPLYSVSRYYGKILIIDPKIIKKDTSPLSKNLGWYSNVDMIDFVPITMNAPKVYVGSPLILTVDDQVVTDMTDYYTFNNDISLTTFKVEGNLQFFYNSQLNRIYTNQDLTGSKIELYFYRTQQNVKIKAVLSSNNGMNAFVTPTVDYYISKLHGQYLKG